VVVYSKLVCRAYNESISKLTVLAWEQWLGAKHLSQDASNGPDINSLGVLLEGQHDLWSAVPASGDVLGHETRVVLSRCGRACKTEVADLKIAVGVQEEVGWLEIAVENIGGVHGLQCAKGLVDEVLAVVIREILGANDAVHIRLHELLDKVDLLEKLIASWLLNIKDRDDVLVVEVAEELHLAKGSQAEHGVVEWGDLLDGNLLSGWLVKGRADLHC